MKPLVQFIPFDITTVNVACQINSISGGSDCLLTKRALEHKHKYLTHKQQALALRATLLFLPASGSSYNKTLQHIIYSQIFASNLDKPTLIRLLDYYTIAILLDNSSLFSLPLPTSLKAYDAAKLVSIKREREQQHYTVNCFIYSNNNLLLYIKHTTVHIVQKYNGLDWRPIIIWPPSIEHELEGLSFSQLVDQNLFSLLHC